MTDKREKGPPGCPGRTRFDIIQRCADMYADPELRRIARNAALVEAEPHGDQPFDHVPADRRPSEPQRDALPVRRDLRRPNVHVALPIG